MSHCFFITKLPCVVSFFFSSFLLFTFVLDWLPFIKFELNVQCVVYVLRTRCNLQLFRLWVFSGTLDSCLPKNILLTTRFHLMLFIAKQRRQKFRIFSFDKTADKIGIIKNFTTDLRHVKAFSEYLDSRILPTYLRFVRVLLLCIWRLWECGQTQTLTPLRSFRFNKWIRARNLKQ